MRKEKWGRGILILKILACYLYPSFPRYNRVFYTEFLYQVNHYFSSCSLGQSSCYIRTRNKRIRPQKQRHASSFPSQNLNENRKCFSLYQIMSTYIYILRVLKMRNKVIIFICIMLRTQEIFYVIFFFNSYEDTILIFTNYQKLFYI